jgi:hypothetical protein
MRVWDSYLSERDKEHARLYWDKQEPFGFGSDRRGHCHLLR